MKKLLALCVVAYILAGMIPLNDLSAQTESYVEITPNIGNVIRVPDPKEYMGAVNVVYKGPSTDYIMLEKISILHNGKALSEKSIQKTLHGVKEKSDELKVVSDTFKAMKESQVPKDELIKQYEKVKNLQSEIMKETHAEIVSINPNIIFNNDFTMGNQQTINILVEVQHNEEKLTITKDLTIKILPPLPAIPLENETQTQENIALSPPPVGTGWYYGDLHVHTGYSTLYGYDRNPSTLGDNCGLEFEAWSGYQIPELTVQAYNVGRRWLSFTDHSYCLSDTEWSNVKSQTTTYGYPNGSNVLMASEETTVDDEGAGYWDEGCGRAAHLGSHGVTSRLGSYEDYCAPYYSSQTGINEVKNRGGLAIINHPTTIAWDWETESVYGETGVEIWNGPWNKTEDPDANYQAVNFWIRRLLRGDHSFASAGSDTHTTGIQDTDPMNVAYLTSFSQSGLKSALSKGNVFVTNGPSLLLWAWSAKSPYNYQNSMMGNTIKADAGQQVTIRVYYNTRDIYGYYNTGMIALHKGIIGQTSEDTEWGWPKYVYVSGYGNYPDFYDYPSSSAYYRAEYIQDGGASRAFTNPVWVNVVAQTLYIPYVIYTPSFRSNIQIINVGTAPDTAMVYLYDSSGNVIASKQTDIINVGGYLQINQAIPWLGSSATGGYLKIESSQPIVATGQYINNSTNDPSNMVGRKYEEATDGLISVSVAGLGIWKSSLVINNLGTSSAYVEMKEYDPTTGMLLSTRTASIPVKGYFYNDDIVNYMGLSNTYGQLTVRSTNSQPLLASTRVYSTSQYGGYFDGQDVADADTTNIIPYAIYSTDFRTNIQIINVGTSSTTATVYAIDSNGSNIVLSKTTSSIPVNGYLQINNVLQWMGASLGSSGYVKIVSNNTEKIITTGQFINNATNDPSTMVGRKFNEAGTILSVSVAGTIWKSTLSIINIGASYADIMLKEFDTSGVLLSTRYITIPVNAIWYSNDIVAYMGLSNTYGFLEIISTNGIPVIAGTRNYNGNYGGFFNGQNILNVI